MRTVESISPFTAPLPIRHYTAAEIILRQIEFVLAESNFATKLNPPS